MTGTDEMVEVVGPQIAMECGLPASWTGTPERWWHELPRGEKRRWLRYARSAITAYEKAMEERGLVRVPREPTEAMNKAAQDRHNQSAIHNYGAGPALGEEYAVMIAAATSREGE